jgi:hypothetical protein
MLLWLNVKVALNSSSIENYYLFRNLLKILVIYFCNTPQLYWRNKDLWRQFSVRAAIKKYVYVIIYAAAQQV